METVVMIIMLMVSFSFLLKLTYHRLPGLLIMSLIPFIFLGLMHEYAAMQSKTQIAQWLEQPALMLDTSVLLTVDVAFQIAFCILMGKKICGKLSRRESILLNVTLWFPGLLIFPVLFSLLVEAVFALPGTDFAAIGWGCGIAAFILIPALAFGIRYLLPESDLRLELMFLVNLITAALGIVATVNGRTAAVGTDSVGWQALTAILALLIIGAVAGLFLNRILTARKIKKLIKQ